MDILRGTIATASLTVTVDGTPTNPSPDSATVEVLREDGSVLVPALSATGHPTVGKFTFPLTPTHTAELDRLEERWTFTLGGAVQTLVGRHEIVGSLLFTETELRNFGDRVLIDPPYTDAMLIDARATILDSFEKAISVAFVPRYRRQVLDGTGTTRLWLDRKRVRRLIKVTVNGVALSAPELAAVHVYGTVGKLVRTALWPVGLQNISVAYEYGYAEAPGEVRDAAMTVARYALVSSDITDRMESFTNDLGTVRLSLPGRKRMGIPAVDAVLARHDETDILGP